MEAPKNDIHKYFGASYNNKLWSYFENPNRTPDETHEMLHYAHSSLLHWTMYDKHTIVNVQRGQYMIAKAYLHAGKKKLCLEFAKECLKTTEANLAEMKDFDIAYAYEVMGKCLRLNGKETESEEYLKLAHQAGEVIKEAGDKEYFVKDLAQEF